MRAIIISIMGITLFGSLHATFGADGATARDLPPEAKAILLRMNADVVEIKKKPR